MKQENFLFVDVISSIFLLILLLCNFMGLLYITDGNTLFSLTISFLVVVCYYFVLQLLKRNKERMLNQGYLKSAATSLFVIFIVFGLVSYFFMVHLVNIETNCKRALQKEVDGKVTLVKEMTGLYDKRANESLQTFEAQFKGKLQAYKNQRSNILRNELSNAPFNLPEAILNSPSNNIDVVASSDAILNAYQIKYTKNHQLLDSIILKKADNYNHVFQDWNRFNLAVDYIELNKFVESSIDLINDKIKELPINNEPVQSIINKKELPLDNPVALAKIYSPNFFLPFIIILLMHIFILIPYFTYKVRKYNSPKQKSSEAEIINHGGTIEL